MSWELRRKILYALSVIIVISAVSVFMLRDTLFPAPTCLDKKMNGYESGVDCGGVCALRCSSEVSPLTVLWSKAIRSGKGEYDLVAMINNNNINNASPQTSYTFKMHDKDGVVFSTLSGTTVAPIGGRFPIIIQSVPLAVEPTSVSVSLTDAPHYSVKESPTSPTVRVLNHRYEGGQIPRVYATIINTKRLEILDLPVRVLLFDEKDNVYAVGQTVVPVLPKEGTREIVITWNETLPKVPTRIMAYPIFNPFEASDF